MSSFTPYIILFWKICISPACVYILPSGTYDFNGRFNGIDSSGLLIEEGNKIPNIDEYYE
jgi:hypothetical protein